MFSKPRLIITVLLSFVISEIHSQAYCGSARYDQEVFSAVTIKSDTAYGSNTDYNGSNVILTMDIYEPSGDTAAQRPMIVWAHGGGFLGGTKNDGDITSLSNHFAKRGYVCVSINYRLGMTNPDQASATQAVYRAVQDMKASIRFFRKDAATLNTYHVDPNMIFVAGSSAGAFTALHLAYMDQPSELPAGIDTTVMGGLEGNSGNPGYSSTVNAVVNLCGALGNKTWMIPGDKPLCSMHGTADNVVPYSYAMLYILNIIPIMVVDGSYSLNNYANTIGVPNVMYTYYGAGHVPFAGSLATMDTTVRFISNFLYTYMGCVPADPHPFPNTFATVAVPEINSSDDEFTIYPNPSAGNIFIQSGRTSGEEINLSLVDLAGRVIEENKVVSTGELVFQRKNILPGIYLLKLRVNGRESIRKICFQ